MDFEEMTPGQLYDKLDRLAEHRRRYGRGHNEGSAYVRDYCKTMRPKVKAELERRGLPITRPDDARRYGPGCAAWQKASQST